MDKRRALELGARVLGRWHDGRPQPITGQTEAARKMLLDIAATIPYDVECVIEGCSNRTEATPGAPATLLCLTCFAERFEP